MHTAHRSESLASVSEILLTTDQINHVRSDQIIIIFDLELLYIKRYSYVDLA